MQSDNKSPWQTIVTSRSLVMEGIVALLKVKQKWELYRSSNNVLLVEQREFVACTGKYVHGETNFLLYVPNIENIIADEAQKC